MRDIQQDNIVFDHQIQTKQVRFGKWVYVIRLSKDQSRPSRKFPTQDAALREAREMLSYMR
jgi:hypothetical protein